MTDRMFGLLRIIDFIQTERYIVIYGIGKDTQMFLKLLDIEDRKKLFFVDKKAENSKIIFMDKEVLSPWELNHTLL